MKTIPFSIEYFNAHPGCKVVDREGRPQRVFAVDHKHSEYPVIASRHYEAGASETIPGGFTTGGLWRSNSTDRSDLFIVVAPKLRAWKPEEVPVGQFKAKGATCWALSIQTCLDSVVFWDYSKGKTINRSYEFLMANYEHSTDGGKTWLPCGVEE